MLWLIPRGKSPSENCLVGGSHKPYFFKSAPNVAGSLGRASRYLLLSAVSVESTGPR